MKGDLSTLRKVCTYASAVMLVGCIVFAVLTAVLAVLGIGSLMSDDMGEMLRTLTGSSASDSLLKKVSAFIVTMMISVMALITVWMVYRIMSSVKVEHSPFIPENAERIKVISLTFLFASVFLLAFGLLAEKGITELLFMFFGSLMVSVVMYCLTIVCRHGVLLQKESDETL